MEEKSPPPSLPPPQNPKPPVPISPPHRDFLTHLEVYLAKRDGVDKLLKISRYASKIILASSLLPTSLPIHHRLKSFESSVGVSRKAFRLGKFIQDVNAYRNSNFDSNHDKLLCLLAYGGEGVYYFVEQFVWFAKSGLIDPKNSAKLQKISAWAEFVGYVGSIGLKLRDLRCLVEAESRLVKSMEIAELRGNGYEEELNKIHKLKEKLLLKKLSIVQDLADGMMAIADITDGKRVLSNPIVLASAGLLSALISTHKNWVSC